MKINRNYLSAITIILALVSAFLRYTTGLDAFFLIYFSLTIALLFIVLPYLKITYYLIFGLIIACIFFFIFPVLLNNDQSLLISFYLLLHFLSSVIIGYSLFVNPARKKIAFIIFTLFSIFFLYHTYKFGIFNPEAYNKLLTSSSRNIVATFLIFITVFFTSTYLQEKNHIPIPYLVIAFIFCLLLYGRTGIALSFLLLIFFSYNRLNLAYKTILIGLSIALLTYIANSLYILLMEKTNFAIGFESDRFDMYSEYLTSLNIYKIIFGQNYQECCHTIVSFDSNPHNSFIDGHSKYGAVHTILYIYLFIKILSRNLPFFILGIVLLIKYNTDTVGLFSPIDFVLWYLFFLVVSYTERSTKPFSTKKTQYVYNTYKTD